EVCDGFPVLADHASALLAVAADLPLQAPLDRAIVTIPVLVEHLQDHRELTTALLPRTVVPGPEMIEDDVQSGRPQQILNAGQLLRRPAVAKKHRRQVA